MVRLNPNVIYRQHPGFHETSSSEVSGLDGDEPQQLEGMFDHQVSHLCTTDFGSTIYSHLATYGTTEDYG